MVYVESGSALIQPPSLLQKLLCNCFGVHETLPSPKATKQKTKWFQGLYRGNIYHKQHGITVKLPFSLPGGKPCFQSSPGVKITLRLLKYSCSSGATLRRGSSAVLNWQVLVKCPVNEASVGGWKITGEKYIEENHRWNTLLEKCLVVSPEAGYMPTVWSSSCSFRWYPTKKHQKSYLRIFTATLVITAKSWKLHKCLLTVERVNKLWHFLHNGMIYSN